MTQFQTHSLDVPGATLHYDIRDDAPGTAPPLFLVGSPMGAAGFGTLAGHFPERTVVTYDPRGVERSKRADTSSEVTPEEHAEDLYRLITALGRGPVDLFASSGGAVNALVLVSRRPEAVRTLVAHEPPAATLLPDHAEALAAMRHIHEIYQRWGMGPAMAAFIALTSHTGPVPADFPQRPAPDPAEFGLPAGDDGSRDDPLLGQNLRSCAQHVHDLATLRNSPARILLAAGANSAGELAHRAAEAMADRIAAPLLTFPGDHAGFLGGEYGMTGKPEEFAASLRQALSTGT